jgi:hypothetical protein
MSGVLPALYASAARATRSLKCSTRLFGGCAGAAAGVPAAARVDGVGNGAGKGAANDAGDSTRGGCGVARMGGGGIIPVSESAPTPAGAVAAG